MLEFLNNLDTPTIDQAFKECLYAPLKLQEVMDSIRKMQYVKTPGPDGFPVEFYKKFSAPVLLEMLNHSLSKSKLPPSLMEASITLLPKSGKDPLDTKSYRPILLLNTDIKILAKLLALRLDKVMSHMLSADQTRFMRDRHSFTNVRKLLTVVHSPLSQDVPEVVVSLDAEKAFDRIEWGYLFATLRRFGFGATFFFARVRLLYASPKVSLITNTLRSQPFPMSRGTRQGCPLSPLLFALAMEPLSI